MNHDTRVSQAKRLLELMDRRTTDLASSVMTQPVADCVCHHAAARERTALFRRLPLLIALGRNEPALQHFHRMLHEALAGEPQERTS